MNDQDKKNKNYRQRTYFMKERHYGMTSGFYME